MLIFIVKLGQVVNSYGIDSNLKDKMNILIKRLQYKLIKSRWLSLKINFCIMYVGIRITMLRCCSNNNKIPIYIERGEQEREKDKTGY